MSRAITDSGSVTPWRKTLARQLWIGGVVSALYVWAYFVTVAVVSPLQEALFPTMVMSLLFLPHGVRVLAAWLYGWRSMAYLLPGAMACNLHFAGERALAPDVLAGTVASLAASPLVFALAHRVWGQRALAVGRARLMTVMVLGFAASVVNLTALQLTYWLHPSEGAVIFLGDASGLIVSVLIVWAVLHIGGRRVPQG